MKLDSEKRARLAKLIRLLGSDNAGEVAAAAHKLQEVLRSSGADLHDLAAIVEDEQIAAMHGRSGQAGWTHDAPGPPPSAPPRRRRQSSLSGGGRLKTIALCIVAVVAVVGAVLMMRGPNDREPRQVSTATAPAHAPVAPNLAAAKPPPVAPKQGPPAPTQVKHDPPAPPTQVKQDPPSPPTQVKQDPPPAPTIQVKQNPPPAPPIQAKQDPPPPTFQAGQDPPPQTVEVMPDPPKMSPTVPRANPVVARSEPTTADTSEARNAARSAVGEIIRQIRFPQRVDRAITMVAVSAYGSQIVASYRAAVPANTMGGGALRRLAVETACGLPNMVSALNRGATHRARYTDPDGTVTEVAIAAQDCDY
jgi:hypothetical protein